MRPAPDAPDIPIWALVHLTHAALQDVATAAGVDILHIKGPTLDRSLQPRRHDSGDADVVVRPAHLERFLAQMGRRGWTLYTSFDEGSPFAHAANYLHPNLAHADIHRLIPGARAVPEVVFDVLWSQRASRQIAHVACATPSPAGQVLVQSLHVARSHGTARAEAWDLADDGLRRDCRVLAARVDAEVALAAGIGELERHVGARDYPLWEYWSGPATDRWGEWRARWRSARGPVERARLVGHTVRVNRTHLRLRLGHEPSRAEVCAEQRRRLRRAWEGVTGRRPAS